MALTAMISSLNNIQNTIWSWKMSNLRPWLRGLKRLGPSMPYAVCATVFVAEAIADAFIPGIKTRPNAVSDGIYMAFSIGGALALTGENMYAHSKLPGDSWHRREADLRKMIIRTGIMAVGAAAVCGSETSETVRFVKNNILGQPAALTGHMIFNDFCAVAFGAVADMSIQKYKRSLKEIAAFPNRSSTVGNSMI